MLLLVISIEGEDTEREMEIEMVFASERATPCQDDPWVMTRPASVDA